jgi:hypothetical protein
VTGKDKNLKPWAPGQSGNPGGRKPGTSQAAKLRTAVGKELDAIVTKLVEQAKGGDISAARLLLERICPPMRAEEQPVCIDLPEGGSLTDQGRAVIAAAGAGEIAPAQASQVLTALGTLAKLIETDELAARIAALEERNATKG